MHSLDQALLAAETAAATLREADQDLRDRDADLRRRRQAAVSGLEPLDTLLENVDVVVDERHAHRWREMHGRSIARSFSRRLRERPNGKIVEEPATLWTPGTVTLSFEDLVAFFPEAAKETFKAAIRAAFIDGADGLSIEARRDLIASLDVEIAAVEREHGEMREIAARHGVDLAPLPSVKRSAEAARLDTERSAADQQRKRDAQAQYDRATGQVDSTYVSERIAARKESRSE